MKKKLSRRDFARTSAASAAAVALPNVLFGSTSTVETSVETSASAQGAAVAKDVIQRGRFAPPPPNFAYGGDASSAVAEYRDSIALAHAPAYQNQGGTSAQTAPAIIRGWREGTTIPAEYYTTKNTT